MSFSISRLAAKWILALICIASFAFMFFASQTDAPIIDELAHIPAGYGYVHNLDYRLNPEHPPLAKALAMLPVLELNPHFPTESDAWRNQVNAQWEMGREFLYESGNVANAIVRTSRFVPIIITILVIMFTYLLASEFVGPIWALMPAFLFAFDPTTLAHGHYVTTDMGAALGTLAALYFFLKFVRAPSKERLIYAGLAFGLAQLMKFSMPLLVPLFIFLAIVLWLRDAAAEKREWHTLAHRLKNSGKIFLRHIGNVFLIFLISYAIVVYPTYFLFTSHYPIAKQTADTEAILASFGNGQTPPGAACAGIRCLADLDIRMSKDVLLRPVAHYMLGVLMVLQRADGGSTIYFLGEVRHYGGWIYFQILFLLKEPLPTLIIVIFGLILALSWIVKRCLGTGRTRNEKGIRESIKNYLENHFGEFSLASFIVLYWGYAMHSPLNIGIRHLLPTIPLILILATVVWRKWIMRLNLFPTGRDGSGLSTEIMVAHASAIAKSIFAASLKYIGLVVLLVWLLAETAFAAPYFLSYFNEIGGGTGNGYHYVTDSNYDWGQDLLRLQTWVNDHPEVGKIAVDYFGGGDPGYYLGNQEVDWWSAKGNPATQGIHWFAISIDNLQKSIQPLAPDETRKPEDSYAWLTAIRPAHNDGERAAMGDVPKPDYIVGTSIFVYHL